MALKPENEEMGEKIGNEGKKAHALGAKAAAMTLLPVHERTGVFFATAERCHVDRQLEKE